jgi:phospholipid/cholesterol/gamma-HCH transport system substrate-binding protein
MEMIVGGTILIALFILIAGVLWLKGTVLTSTMTKYSVLFPNVGTLQAGDPVMVNGVKKGTVVTIGLRGTRVAAVIQLGKDVALTDSSRVTVQNIGIMGERMIGIQLSEKGHLLQPNRKDGTVVQYANGYFDAGIAEAMGLLGNVLTDVQTLLGNVSAIMDSTVGDTAFQQQFKTIMVRLDTVSGVAQQMLVENRPALGRSIAMLDTVTRDINTIVKENRQHISTMTANGSDVSERLVVIVRKADSLTSSIAAMVDKVNKGEGTVGLLMNNGQVYYDLKKSISDLDSLVNNVNHDGLKVRIKLGFKNKKEKK